MGLKLEYKHEGMTFPNAYWRVGEIRHNLSKDCAEIFFHSYQDEAARSANKKGVLRKAQVYGITGAAYSDIFMQPITDKARLQKIYEHAKNTLEGEVPMMDEDGNLLDNEGEILRDAEGNPIKDSRKSFFDGAIDVLED